MLFQISFLRKEEGVVKWKLEHVLPKGIQNNQKGPKEGALRGDRAQRELEFVDLTIYV